MAAGVALVCGLAAGPLIVRLPESTASIATFALLVVVNNIFQNATSLTRGNQTFFGVPRSVNFGLVFGTLAVVVIAAAAFKWSPLGLRARAVREDPIAAEASGIRVSTARLWPFALSAFITGAGGALWAFDVTAFSSNSFYLSQSIGVIAMMILGGYRSVTGAILGATVMSVWLELVRHVENGVTIAAVHIRAMPGLSQLFLGLALVSSFAGVRPGSPARRSFSSTSPPAPSQLIACLEAPLWSGADRCSSTYEGMDCRSSSCTAGVQLDGRRGHTSLKRYRMSIACSYPIYRALATRRGWDALTPPASRRPSPR